MKKNGIILIILFLIAVPACPGHPQEKSIIDTVLWSTFLPGGGHFYLGQPDAGNAYLLSEGLLVIVGFGVRESLMYGEWNFFFVNALKIHELGMFTSYREARILNEDIEYSSPIDRTALHDLALAPFRWENIKSPFVYGFFLAGIAANAIEASMNAQRRDYSGVSSVRIMGVDLDRGAGTAAYGGMWLTLSLSAAVSEECAYRGIMQVECEESMGRIPGLLVSSCIFGLGHVADWTKQESWISGGIAALAGTYLGWLFQKEGYKLSKPIAAHFWFNVGAGATLFIMDPQNNPLGLRVNFSF